MDGNPNAQDRSHAERLQRLRAELARRGLDGLLVPTADEYQNEYVPASARRIPWLSGFTGSAGLIVVLAERAALFSDGRYTLQMAQQVDATLFDLQHITEQPPTAWITRHLPKGGRLGYDPWLFTRDGVERFARAAAAAGGEMVAADGNPLDAVWDDRPPVPAAPVVPHALAYAGEEAAAKRDRLGRGLAEAGADAAVITAPDSIAWLLNIRGGDVPHTPLPLGFAILHADGTVELFLDPAKRTEGLDAHLGNGVSIDEPGRFGAALDRLGRDGRRVQADPAGTAAWVFQRLGAAGARIVAATDPCQLPKACKNDVELAGTRAAHVRDGAAVCRFLCWLEREAPHGGVDEMWAAAHLRQCREATGALRDLSFPTISGAGPNGAIVHYQVTTESNRRLGPGELYLVDSGAQYLDGTTDITRTVAVGEPTAEMRDRFTRVLKGHIALATAVFPEGTSGSQLDVLARAALWQAGLDYDHGTGHGVGSYLGVHEGPQRISKMPNQVALRPGMIVSNEPGYYRTGAYGIRIENLVAVRPAEVDGAERRMLGFETLTRAPIDRRLVDTGLLTAGERAWLDGYHARVRDQLSDLVDDATRAWLDAATRPL